MNLRPGELQTAIIIPKASYEGYKGHYIKYAMRNAMDIATIGCSVNVKLSADKKTMEDVRIAYGVAGPIPMRAVHAEEQAKGQPVTEAADQGRGPGCAGGHPPQRQLASFQGLPGAHRRGAGRAGAQGGNPSFGR